MPTLIEKFFLNSKSLNPNLNQCLANWYESDGYIGRHSDDTRQLKIDSEIFSFSFGPSKRYFLLEPKLNGFNFKIELSHNILVIMGGKCQSTHNHSVEKVTNNTDGRRLNLTFR